MHRKNEDFLSYGSNYSFFLKSFVEPIKALQKHFCLLLVKLWTLCWLCIRAKPWGVHLQASLPLCERSVAHLPDALWAFTFRHPCLPTPSEKRGSKAKLLKISRKADRDAPCDQARMLDSVRTEVLHDAKPTNERKLALGLRLKQGRFSCLPRVLQGCKTN